MSSDTDFRVEYQQWQAIILHLKVHPLAAFFVYGVIGKGGQDAGSLQEVHICASLLDGDVGLARSS